MSGPRGPTEAAGNVNPVPTRSAHSKR
jgi:hypothetical protein